MEQLINMLGHRLARKTKRNQALSTNLQLKIALHWMGTGSQYHAVSDMHGVTKGSVCKAVHSVVEAVNEVIYKEYVKWPENMQVVVQKFYMIKGTICLRLSGRYSN